MKKYNNKYGEQIKENEKKLKSHKNIKMLNAEMNDKLKEIDLPEKPKKISTMYFKFRTDLMKTLKEKNPDIKTEEVNKKIAE